MENFNIFNFLEKDDKELIHSQFIRFLFNYFEKDFLNELNRLVGNKIPTNIKLKCLNEISFTTQINKANEENKRGRFDVIFSKIGEDSFEKGEIVAVIENKFKSFPTIEQLNLYDSYLEKETVKILLTFSKEYINLPQENSWIIIDYKDFLELCNKIKSHEIKEDSIKIFFNHYIKFLTGYVNKFDELTKENGIKKVIKENEDQRLINFWLSLSFYAVAAKVQKAINGFITSVFHGRQFTPGLNLWSYNAKNNWMFQYILHDKAHPCWFELQNEFFKLKFKGEHSYKNYDELKTQITSKLPDYESPRSSPSEKDKSFTVIQKKINFDDINNTSEIIVKEFNSIRDALKLE